MSVKVGIAGITGRVGRLLEKEVFSSFSLELVGGTAMNASGTEFSVPVFSDLGKLVPLCDVIIDFTNAAAITAHSKAFNKSNCAWVLGTTGLSHTEQKLVEQTAKTIPVVHAANFSAGVTVITRLAAQLAASLPAENFDIEIVEMHHRQKVDAPSGTALSLGRAMAKARNVVLEDVIESGRHGITGPRKNGAIGFSALRGGQIIGEHNILLTSEAEQVVLTHKAFDRSVFAKGAIQAALWCIKQQPGYYTMEDVLGF